jgi:hypothetical protein
VTLPSSASVIESEIPIFAGGGTGILLACLGKRAGVLSPGQECWRQAGNAGVRNDSSSSRRRPQFTLPDLSATEAAMEALFASIWFGQ